MISFDFGTSIVNTFDNVLDSSDTIVVNIQAYVSNNGVGLSNQVRHLYR